MWEGCVSWPHRKERILGLFLFCFALVRNLGSKLPKKPINSWSVSPFSKEPALRFSHDHEKPCQISFSNTLSIRAQTFEAEKFWLPLEPATYRIIVRIISILHGWPEMKQQNVRTNAKSTRLLSKVWKFHLWTCEISHASLPTIDGRTVLWKQQQQ